MYDIIGDVHGYAEHLEALLKQLGYETRLGVYHHPERQAIFLGDFVNRGKDVKGVLKIVRPMIEEGAAQTVIGNHEYNLVSFFTKNEQGEYLRPHTVKNIRQVRTTLKAFENSQKKLNNYMEWFKSLPLFLELEGIRIVHATWYQPYIKFIKKNYPGNRLGDALLRKSAVKGNKEYKVMEALLKGVEYKLPKGMSFKDTDGIERKRMRAKWWEDPKGKTYSELATREADRVPDIEVPESVMARKYMYDEDAPPVFIGHYCLRKDKPELFRKNICCVDFCVVKQGKLTAYRWQGERELTNMHFVQVKG